MNNARRQARIGKMGKQSFLHIGEANIEIVRIGVGPPLLLLESEEQRERDSTLVAELSQAFEVLIPSPPGFGHSNRPDYITSVDDVAYVYNALLEQLNLSDVTVLAFSLGGWIAAEMATKTDHRLARMILVAPYGVKHGGTTDRDIADIWILHPEKVTALKWRDPALGKRDFSDWSDDDLRVVARNNESFARYCWQPYMHNPKLRHRLGGVRTPVHMIWGANDGIVTPDYGRQYAKLFPACTFETIAEAGHMPHIEQPAQFAEAIRRSLL
jgi:pimeloyl-ACP methyl ester carboxylesterase